MGFSEAVRNCLGKYATFSGRARRPEYWWFFLFVMLGGLVARLVDGALFGFGTPQAPETRIVGPLFSLAMFLPLLAAGWRRMHDTGRPGWYLLIPMLISLAILFFAGFGLAARMAGDGPGAGPGAMMPGMGAGLAAAAAIAQLAASILILWWLTRPSQKGPNDYGPEPRVRPVTEAPA
ncbi:DUF805 domain-containing protein [Rhodosalinus sp. K401]|uniref:DUF805 domain-containing protein n=1 Tax=Rhodosalinus sp. K401 TaxID=3239195 RepID=UPI003525BFEE